MKKRITLTEEQLHRVVAKAAKRIVKESVNGNGIQPNVNAETLKQQINNFFKGITTDEKFAVMNNQANGGYMNSMVKYRDQIFGIIDNVYNFYNRVSGREAVNQYQQEQQNPFDN